MLNVSCNILMAIAKTETELHSFIHVSHNQVKQYSKSIHSINIIYMQVSLLPFGQSPSYCPLFFQPLRLLENSSIPSFLTSYSPRYIIIPLRPFWSFINSNQELKWSNYLKGLISTLGIQWNYIMCHYISFPHNNKNWQNCLPTLKIHISLHKCPIVVV